MTDIAVMARRWEWGGRGQGCKLQKELFAIGACDSQELFPRWVVGLGFEA